MTKTTEELKHAMYHELNQITGAAKFDPFQSALEAYLEALRQDHCRATEERDSLRNKLQAFEFAKKSAGELLRDALATVKRQREFIRTLYTSRKARKSKTGTSDQSSSGNVAGEELKRSAGKCGRCKGTGMESNANGQWTGPCYKCKGPHSAVMR